MTFQLDPIWPWPFVLLVAGLSLGVVVTTYRQRVAHLPPRSRRVLMGLRILTWAILTLAMLRPSLEFTEIDRHATEYAIVVDNSRSMGVTDGPGGATRREAALKMLEDVRPELENLGKEIKILYVDFAKETALVEAFTAATPGEQSAIGSMLDALPKLSSGKKLVGALLISDGAQRAVTPFDTDPRSAANRLAELQIRIDPVGVGASGITDSALDLALEDLEVSPTVFVKNTVVVGARVRALGAAGQEITVRAQLEDRENAEPGKPGLMKQIGSPRKYKVSQSQEVIPVEVSFTALNPGEFKLRLEVLALEGEPRTDNNSLTTIISVLQGGVSVAYFDREHRQEQKFLRRIDESPDIRLDFKAIRTSRLGDKPRIDPEWFEPHKYDVYIIGSVRASVFGPELLKKLSRAVEQGAGLMMLGGTQSFGPGGYAETPLADELPVIMYRTELQNGDEVDPALHYLKSLQMLPTQQGLAHFVMRLETADKNEKLWRSLPQLDEANRFAGLKDGAVVLAEAREPQGRIPLLVAQEFGRSRTMAFAADTTWLWYQAGMHEAHQRFWQQAVLWLAHKDVQGDESVWVRLDSRRYRVGQAVNMVMGARDADKRTIEDAEFKIEITDPDGKKHNILPQSSGSEMQGRFLETRKPGDYRVHVDALRGGQAIGMGAEARFIVYDQDLELHNPAADFALLEEIARITGGANVPPGELGAHLKKLAKLGLNVEVTRIERVLLWDNWPLLVTFVCAMTLEWFLRKRRGLV